MRLIALACVGACGCAYFTDSFATNDFSGDLYPIDVETTSGAVVVGLRQPGVADRTAVVDLLSPFTLVDPGPGVSPSLTTTSMVVLGGDAAGALDLPRARLSDARVFTLHPCGVDTCTVGTGDAPRPYDAIIGADALAGDAVRLRLGSNQILLLADVAGSEQDRSAACDAVFPSPYRGGGTLVIAGSELEFTGRRVTMQTCIGADPDPTLPQGLRGTDALMLVSTGIGISLLGEATYERYRTMHDVQNPNLPPAPPLDQLPAAVVVLPSGPIPGRRATIDRLALIARSSSAPHAPCRQVFAHHLLLERDCAAGDDCPCENGDTFCPLPAIVEFAPPAGLDVLVISDEEPTLQALRTELRPDQAEIDGILGTSALQTAELDIDYPNARVLARCTSADCQARPALPNADERSRVAGCIAATTAGRRD